MKNISNKVKIILFADYTNIIFKSDNTIDLEHIMQEYIYILYEWPCIYKLSKNIQKSTVIIFNIRNSLLSIRLNITINNMPIECISNIKFLGLFIDDKLNWKIHIYHILRKLLKSIAILNKSKYNLNEKSLNLVYYAIFKCHFEYFSHI